MLPHAQDCTCCTVLQQRVFEGVEVSLRYFIVTHRTELTVLRDSSPPDSPQCHKMSPVFKSQTAEGCAAIQRQIIACIWRVCV